MVVTKDNPLLSDWVTCVFYSNFPEDCETIYKFVIYNISNIRYSDYLKNKDYYIVYRVKFLEDYKNLSIEKDKFIDFHISKNGFRIAFDQYNKNDLSKPQSSTSNCEIHLSRDNRKRTTISYVKFLDSNSDVFE